MKYKVEYTPHAVRQIKKLEPSIQKRIYEWVDRYLVDCENPRFQGRTLLNCELANWRYRIGDYRIVANIEDDKIVIKIVRVGHRREIYMQVHEEIGKYNSNKD